MRALCVAACVWFVGVLLSFIVSDPIGGSLSFVALVLAVPALPALGVPAAGGTGRFLLALVVSGAVWWVVGQVAAVRATRRPVAGNREWLVAFVQLGIGLWLGALGGLALGALALGAL